MPVIEAGSPDVARLAGMHLFHYSLSNCSQRVRILLEEKRLRWISHPVDLRRNAHATAAYHQVNPRGLVPALVHDGRVVIESLDILQYLEDAFPDPPFAAGSGTDRFSALAATVQPALKLLSHEFLFKPARHVGAAELEALADHHADPSLLAFLREFSAQGGFTTPRIAAAVAVMDAAFAQLDAALHGSDWLAGGRFSLADIAWMPNVRRMALVGFPLASRPALADWYRRVQARPSFRAALLRYEPAPVRAMFLLYGWYRRATGTGVGHFLAPAAAS